MGAGSFPAGGAMSTPFVSNDPAVNARPRALYFDPLTRDFPLDANGRYVETHPTDSKVALALQFLAGRLKCAPEVGWTIDKLADFFTDRGPSGADQRARAALRSMIVSGEIYYAGVGYEAAEAGPLVAVRYFNLQLVPIPKTPTTLYLLPK
jgi:hypothetical protein